MNNEEAVKALKELGHDTRLKVFRRLVKAGFEGLPVGQLQEELEVPGSTLSHHISSLMAAGLVKQQRDGRTLYCIAQFDHLQALIGFLQDECCLDADAQ
ncbi:ArsR family transcriptional regulator [Rhodobacteraceae bacterium RKSG542]|uniref:ArsR/SmtB family transcription factor n=1 Tax=Pseudovibrio flavus TaxID=2529854 RepID=UPI0012BBEC4D|nr:metalloregulator ArsR/SmtB family transcription factor [Pseudovibrio flavus]MTI18283.1 ArsR family transcriptional regulator [Pseudovibrio flavus]